MCIGAQEMPNPDAGSSSSLLISLSSSELSTIDTALSEFSELLAEYAHRLRRVHIHDFARSTNSVIWRALAGLGTDGLPLLEWADLRGGLLQHGTPTPLANLLAGAPQLRSLHIGLGFTDRLGPVWDLGLQWMSITDLQIDSYDTEPNPLSTINKIATSCPALSSLSLYFSMMEYVASRHKNPSSVPIQFTHLRSLDIRARSYISEGDASLSQHLSMFSALKTPALKQLNVDAYPSFSEKDFSYVGPTMPFHSMILQSGCQIERLEINHFLLGNLEALYRSLDLLPSLASLKIINHHEWCGYMPEIGDATPHMVSLLRVLSSPAKPGYPDIEELTLEMCAVEYAEGIFTSAAALPKLKRLSVEFGTTNGTVESTMRALESDRMRKAVSDLRDGKNVQVICKWQASRSRTIETYDIAYAGISGGEYGFI
ncbi:hypothetical protein V5O48_012057 [Marasmius crinis-equi]|uniref:Uncharacterized protein n=1 Tax=Marasmius crinis-equi TaxID=585013 RepID=A0ABR3F3U8_9AGAR